MAILEFIISLLFCFLLISLLVSWIIDIYSSRINKKGKFLEKMLAKFVGQDDAVNWAVRLYKHPMIESLSYKNTRLTSLITTETFSNVITDLIIEEGRDYSFTQNKDTKGMEYHEEESEGFMKDVKKGIDTISESDLKRTMKLFFEKSEGDSGAFLTSIQNWYNDYMLRVNYAYKRLLRMPLWFLGFIIAISFNIDAVKITTELWNDSKLRKTVSDAATEFVESYPSSDSIKVTKDFFEYYEASLMLPIGWEFEKRELEVKIEETKISGDNDIPNVNTDSYFCFLKKYFEKSKNQKSTAHLRYLLIKIIGYLLTGMIASFGAPFWYDALQKIVGLKKSIKLKTE